MRLNVALIAPSALVISDIKKDPLRRPIEYECVNEFL